MQLREVQYRDAREDGLTQLLSRDTCSIEGRGGRGERINPWGAMRQQVRDSELTGAEFDQLLVHSSDGVPMLVRLIDLHLHQANLQLVQARNDLLRAQDGEGVGRPRRRVAPSHRPGPQALPRIIAHRKAGQRPKPPLELHLAEIDGGCHSTHHHKSVRSVQDEQHQG